MVSINHLEHRAQKIETGGCLSNWIPIRLVTSLPTTLKNKNKI